VGGGRWTDVSSENVVEDNSAGTGGHRTTKSGEKDGQHNVPKMSHQPIVTTHKLELGTSTGGARTSKHWKKLQ